MTDKVQSAQHFADAAAEFITLVSNPPAAPDAFARALLACLCRLYSFALALPDVAVGSEDPEFPRPTDVERKRICNNVAGMFGEHNVYWFQYDPIYPRDGLEQPVCSLLSHDCAEIYDEIVGPLAAFSDGSTDILDDIIWEWSGISFQSHWGIHATHAIYALHWIVFDHG